MVNPIKIGIVGLGRAGSGMHLAELVGKEEMFQIVAVCDTIVERGTKAAEKYGCNAYQNIDDLIADSNVELVDIATRTSEHFEHAYKALKAGKNVFLEKPACMTASQLEQLYDISNKEGLPKLFIRQNRRFEAGFQAVWDIIKSGVLGNVFDVRLEQYGYQRRDDWQTISEFGGGQMLNWGPHIIDHALCFLSDAVDVVRADLKQAAAGGDCEDHFSIMLRGKKGRAVTLTISGSVALGEGRRYVAYGDRGAVEFKNNVVTARYINPEQVLPEVVSDPGTPGDSFGASGTFESAVNPEWMQTEQKITSEDLSIIWNYLYEAIREGKPFPIKDEEVLSIMRVIDAAKKEDIVKTNTIGD